MISCTRRIINEVKRAVAREERDLMCDTIYLLVTDVFRV
jgi:hypothetical protein